MKMILMVGCLNACILIIEQYRHKISMIHLMSMISQVPKSINLEVFKILSLPFLSISLSLSINLVHFLFIIS